MKTPGPAVLVIFGAAGDLTRRKLIPAMYNLSLDGLLSEKFTVIGVDRKEMDAETYATSLRDGIETFSRRGKAEDASWKTFISRVSYLEADFSDGGLYSNLEKTVDTIEQDWKTDVACIFYFAVPPAVVRIIVEMLGKTGLAGNRDASRVVVEKPFGHDLESAHELNLFLTGVFRENQIFRIDHYLGKETVQNILAFRFANALFEPVWDRRYIDHVQISVAERLGVEHRGGYYEHAGALRDMIQNHLLQVLCLIAMEPMVSFDADEIRSKKLDVLRAIRRIPENDIGSFAVRGQYGEGWMKGTHVAGYRSEPNVEPDSETETFAAVKLCIDNWRWQDVPFYLRTGKRLPDRLSEVCIQFRPMPHRSFPPDATFSWEPNRLIIRIAPEEGILLYFQAKQPGSVMRLRPVNMFFSYAETFGHEPPEAYETLLLDVMKGDATLFMRADQSEEAWSIIMPILNVWSVEPPIDFPNYHAGNWGPEAAEDLIARDGRSWFTTDPEGYGSGSG